MKQKSVYFSAISLVAIQAFSTHCSTVRIIEGKSFQISQPYFKEAPEPKEEIRKQSSDDYKAREKMKKFPHFTIAPLVFPKEFTNAELRSLLIQELDFIWAKTSGKRILFDKPWDNGERPLSDYQSADIDAVIFPKFSVDESSNTFQISYRIEDPVNKKEYGVLQANGKFIAPDSNGKNGKMKRLELYKDGSSYRFLNEIKSPQIEFETKPSKSEIAEILKKSVSGTLTVTTTSSDTTLFADGKEIGKLPLANITIPDGLHLLEFSKPGKTAIKREVVLRAGETKEIFHEWDDDMTLGAIKALSYPPGLKISWDGYLKGDAPVFSNDLSPGNYKIEFSRKDEKEKDRVLGEQTVKVESKRVSSIAFPIELINGFDPSNESLWQVTGEGGIYPQFGKELLFKKVGEPIAGWHGISTHPIIPDSLELQVTAYSQDEVGTGKIAITYFLDEKKNFTVELENSRISLYQFPSNGIAIANYEFKESNPEKGRPVRFVADKEEKLLKIYFGNKKIFETTENFDSLWRIALLVKSDNMPKSKTFKSLSLTYPKYVLPKK